MNEIDNYDINQRSLAKRFDLGYLFDKYLFEN